jgi:chromosome segregation ATPase
LTKEEIERTLRHMEQLRMDAEETDDLKEKRRMIREYQRLWDLIKPHVVDEVRPRIDKQLGMDGK